MGNNHLNRSRIQASSPNKTKFISLKATLNQDADAEGDHAKVMVSIRFLQHTFQCFSDWEKKEMDKFWDFNRLIHDKTWHDVYQSAGKEKKTGLGYTVIPSNNYPTTPFKSQLSQDITLFELRVDQKIRVHGFRHYSIFHICWLDRDHSICK